MGKTINEQQLKVVETKGGNYPPPCQGMLCLAEFFMEGTTFTAKSYEVY